MSDTQATSRHIESILEALQRGDSTDWTSIDDRRAREDAKHAEATEEAARAWDAAAAEGVIDRTWRRAALNRMLPTIAFRDCEAIRQGLLGKRRALAAAQRWLDTDKPVLVLAGTPGNGKSVAAHSVGVEWARQAATQRARYHREDPHHTLEQRVDAYSLDVGRWCGTHGARVVAAPMVPRTFDPWGSEGEALLAWDHPFVILDDLGTEADTGRWVEDFGQLIDARLSMSTAKGRMVITTNLAKGDIRPRYGDRIADRLNGHSIVVEVRGASERGNGQGL